VHGERWRVQATGARSLPGAGARVRIVARDGLTLTVEPLEDQRQQAA
jgi:membrane-bound serine protease (ClpP class)